LRESKSAELDENYIKAFHKIDSGPNQYLMVVENSDEIIGTCYPILYYRSLLLVVPVCK
jgi:hypothetical protein